MEVKDQRIMGRPRSINHLGSPAPIIIRLAIFEHSTISPDSIHSDYDAQPVFNVITPPPPPPSPCTVSVDITHRKNAPRPSPTPLYYRVGQGTRLFLPSFPPANIWSHDTHVQLNWDIDFKL